MSFQRDFPSARSCMFLGENARKCRVMGGKIVKKAAIVAPLEITWEKGGREYGIEAQMAMRQRRR